MTEAVKVRTQVLPEFERTYGTRLSFTDLITKAVARAILDHPIINASIEGNRIRIHGEVNVGLAVALDDGLIVPVIHNADRRSLPEISLETKQLAEKARAGKLSSREISGGTFTITNLGAYGVDIFNPVITPGQSAILGVCRIVDKPVVVGGQILIRSMMNLCLSFDHRVMDGAPAAQFLANVKEMLEAPNQLLI
jgi:pyruvate dehydrogenase E2 component (dihydrolipoamide acetyltransferase)